MNRHSKRAPVAREFVRLREVAQKLGVSVPTLATMIAAGKLPQPVRLAPKVVGWPAGIITAALNDLLYGTPEAA